MCVDMGGFWYAMREETVIKREFLQNQLNLGFLTSVCMLETERT